MPKANRKCLFCNHSYYFCPSCNDNYKPSWYALFDCEECKELFDLLTKEFLGKVPTEEAKKILELKGIGLDGQYSNGVREHIERVLSYESKKENEEEEAIIEEQTVTEPEVVMEQEVVVEQEVIAEQEVIVEEEFPMNPPEFSIFETRTLEQKPLHKKKRNKPIVKNIDSPTED